MFHMKQYRSIETSMNQNTKQFLERINIVDPEIHFNLSQYHDLLFDYNQKVNLVSRKDVSHIWENHIFPSLMAVYLVEFPQHSIFVDFGSGGGLPGIVLKIVRPDLTMILVDSIHKKTVFLKSIISKLNLSNTDVINMRLTNQNQLPTQNGKTDFVTARSVSGFESVYKDCHHLLKKNGSILTWKGTTDLETLTQFTDKFQCKTDVLIPSEHLKSFSRRLEDLNLVRIYKNSTNFSN